MTFTQHLAGLMLFACAASSVGAGRADDPKSAALGLLTAAAAGQKEGVERLLAVTTKQQDVLKIAFVEVVMNAARYERAMRQVYGSAATGRYGVSPADEETAWTAAKVDGNAVTLTLGKPVTLAMVRQDGRWKMSFDAVAAYLRAKGVDASVPADEPVRRWADVAVAFEAAAKDVTALKYADATAAAAATRTAVEDAARGANAN